MQSRQFFQLDSPSVPKTFRLFGLKPPPKRSCPDDDESPKRPRQRVKQTPLTVAEQAKGKDLAIGVNADDLPIAGPDANNIQKNYEKHSEVRKLDWRTDSKGQPIRKDLRDSISLTAAFAQTRGREVSDPCTFCKRGQGVWKSCVVGFDTKESSKLHGTCANCRFSRRSQCNLRTNKTDDSLNSEEQPLALAYFRPSEIDEWQGCGDTEEQNSHDSEATQDDGAFEDVPKTTITKEEPKDQTSSIAPASQCLKILPLSRHDGKVLRFPVGPERFDDLSFLRQGVKDMQAHLDVMERGSVNSRRSNSNKS